MKVHTSMPKKLIPFFNRELRLYMEQLTKGNLQIAWLHLERAHVIGQAYPYQHSYVHWKMLLFGFRIKNTKEIIGQIPRLLIGGVKSFIGKIPVGNTGGSDIPPLRSLPIQDDIKEMLKNARIHD